MFGFFSREVDASPCPFVIGETLGDRFDDVSSASPLIVGFADSLTFLPSLVLAGEVAGFVAGDRLLKGRIEL